MDQYAVGRSANGHSFRTNEAMHNEALLWVDKVIWDREVLDSIGLCLRIEDRVFDAAVQFVHRVMAYRTGFLSNL